MFKAIKTFIEWFECFHGWELSADASNYLDDRDITQYGIRWFAYDHKPKERKK